MSLEDFAVTSKRNKFELAFVLAFTVAMLPLVFGSGCLFSPGSDDNGGDPPDTTGTPTVTRETIPKLLEEYLPDAYARQDSADYREALDQGYEFTLLPSDPDDPNPVEFWDRTGTPLKSKGRIRRFIDVGRLTRGR